MLEEKMSYSLKVEKEKFGEIWTKWTEDLKLLRSDFIRMLVLCISLYTLL